jgi:hypothetical protein
MRILLVALAISVPHAACDRASHQSAADDPKRYLGGSLYHSKDEPIRPIAMGPLFLTDIMVDGPMGQIFTSRDAACQDKEARGPGSLLFSWFFGADERSVVQSHHGMRLLIPEGKTLCLQSTGGQSHLVWSGFRA